MVIIDMIRGAKRFYCENFCFLIVRLYSVMRYVTRKNVIQKKSFTIKNVVTKPIYL